MKHTIKSCTYIIILIRNILIKHDYEKENKCECELSEKN